MTMNSHGILMAILTPLIAVCLCSTGSAQEAATGKSATGPTPFPDAKDAAAWPGRGPIRVFEFMKGERGLIWRGREKSQGAVVFIGDSLTRGWKGMAAAFPNWKTANSGVGGDVSRGMLWRFREDVLDLKPRAVVICIGFNDLTASGKTADVEANLAEALKLAWAENPELPIALCLVPPREEPKNALKPGAIAELNDRITKLGAGKEHLVVVDLATPFTGADGKPKPELFVADRVHLSEAGYQAWADALRPALEKLGVK